jgi:stage II sporulation protein D
VVDGRTARFSGRGYGHGVGLCQWGARAMGEQGYSARQILRFYYPGATVGLLDG